jgi:photosystem II stability/assembly factor-like uncharacterized protein
MNIFAHRFAGALSLRAILRWAALALIITPVWACEARVDLSDADARARNPVHETDRFQAAARHGDTVVLVGDAGTVLVSADRGAAWERVQLPQRQPPVLPDLIDVTACPDGTFVALDGARGVWFSGLDPREWALALQALDEDGVDLTCDPTGRVWVVGAFTQITSSVDRGHTWRDQSLGDDAIFTSIQFTGSDVGIIVGEFGLHYRSFDGGASWAAHKSIPNNFYPLAALFQDRREGWLTGLQGTVLYTTDGGAHWVRQDTGARVPVYGVAVGDTGLRAVGGRGTVFSLSGESWQRVKREDAGYGYLRAILPLGNGEFLAAGGNGKILILDGVAG